MLQRQAEGLVLHFIDFKDQPFGSRVLPSARYCPMAPATGGRCGGCRPVIEGQRQSLAFLQFSPAGCL